MYIAYVLMLTVFSFKCFSIKNFLERYHQYVVKDDPADKVEDSIQVYMTHLRASGQFIYERELLVT